MAAGTSLIFSVTFGKVAHPPARVRTETNRKKKEKDLARFMAISSRENFIHPVHRVANAH